MTILNGQLEKWFACLLVVYGAVENVESVETLGGKINLADVPCGQQWRRGSRIVGGQNAVPGEFPWLVSIKRRGGHICGGTIVNKRWVITAGHCLCSGPSVLSVDGIRVTVGEHDLKSKTSRSVDMKVAQIHFHPGYRCPRFSDDIALLELESDITWSRSVGPACLPQTTVATLSDRTATTAGWGWSHEDYSKGTRSDILQKVQVTVVDNDQCRAWYSSQGKKVKILDSQICAGNEFGGKDACWADSGGPLMVSESGEMTVVGVVSTGIGCGRPRLPGLYARTSEYVPWLLNVIRLQLPEKVISLLHPRQTRKLDVVDKEGQRTRVHQSLTHLEDLNLLCIEPRTSIWPYLEFQSEADQRHELQAPRPISSPEAK